MPKSIPILYVLLLLLCTTTHAQQNQPNLKTIALFDTLRKTMPREKLYLHMDKPSYTNIDTIWFKAYLIDASINTYSAVSGLIHIELINTQGQIARSLALPTTMGLAWGGFALDPALHQPGNYTIRAYTNWMQNFGSNNFFTKQIKVIDINTAAGATIVAKTVASTPKNTKRSLTIEDQNKIDLQFLPEGGSWMIGKAQQMAFKAVDINGKGIQVSGTIVDSKQQKIVDFRSNEKGMGKVGIIAMPAERYTAIVSNGQTNLHTDLPSPINNGTVLKVDNNYADDSLSVTLFSDLIDQELTMIGQARGILCFVTQLGTNTKAKTFKVAKSIFPTGVCQVVVLNHKNQLLNERNFFINHQDQLRLNLLTDSTKYSVRDSIPIHLSVTDAAQQPVTASFSMAITADNQISKDTLNDAHILSYFLLSADLKGEIENPGYYFNAYNQTKHNDLDALMLTQGWVSYQWDLNTKQPLFKVEKDYTISGKVTNVLNQPIANAKVILFGSNKNFLLIDTVTNRNGSFVFDRLPMLDSASFVIQALNAKGKKGTLGIELNDFKRPAITNIPQAAIAIEQPLDSISAHFLANQKQAYQASSADGLLLKAVTIVGKRTIKKSKNLNGPGEADQTITESDLDPIGKQSLLQLLEEKVNGFRLGNVRKSPIMKYFVGFGAVKLIIDGIDVDALYAPSETPMYNEHYQYIKTYLDYYHAEDLNGIEVMQKSRNAMRYRSQFINPLDEAEYTFIEITTKTGAGPFLKKSANLYLYKAITYGDNKVFYQPKYTAANKNSKKADLRSTLYWNPNIITNQKGDAAVHFFAADQKGTYTVWVEGADMQGNFGMQTLKVTIK